jgi:hypothetical protein
MSFVSNLLLTKKKNLTTELLKPASEHEHVRLLPRL